jgi:hypothetical protein
LAVLIATAQKQHDGLSISTAINPVTGAYMNAQLDYAHAHRFAVTEVACLHSANPHADTGFDGTIA